jgi:hypothetical protein
MASSASACRFLSGSRGAVDQLAHLLLHLGSDWEPFADFDAHARPILGFRVTKDRARADWERPGLGEPRELDAGGLTRSLLLLDLVGVRAAFSRRAESR